MTQAFDKYTDDIYYRKDTTDLDVLKEVLEKKCYCRPRLNFDVEPGESWLDLGANIGAFSIYCLRRGAFFAAYEPDPSNYNVLYMNVGHLTGTLESGRALYHLQRAAVTDSPEASITFWKDMSHSRRSCFYNRNKKGAIEVPNVSGGVFKERFYDGVKMDIEGSEGPLIDKWLLPSCNKLVLEYHTSVDPSAANLRRRLEILQSKFEHVHYPPEWEWIFSGNLEREADPFFDRLIFCWNGEKDMWSLPASERGKIIQKEVDRLRGGRTP